MASGITAQLLHVDLTTRQTRAEELPETTVRKYLKGGALAAHLLLREMLPQRMHEGIGNGPLQGQRIEPEQFLAARRTYYAMAGWDPETGRPTAAKLAELGVE